MTLLNRLAAALMSAAIALSAAAAPIELTPHDFELAATGIAPATVLLEEDNAYLQPQDESDLNAPLLVTQADPNVVSVPEPVHYKLLLLGVALLLVAGARRRSHSPWNCIRVSQQAD